LPAGIYATPSYNQIRGRGNIQLVGDPNGGTTVRQELDVSGCANADDCAYWKLNQCVYQADISHDGSAPCWQVFVNTPARNIYIKDITFDGGYAQHGAPGRCSASWSDSIAVSLIATRDVLFDDVTFQNYCDPVRNNPERDPATGLGQCAAACHPGIINFSGGNDNIWCRRCRFLGPGRYPWYSDGTRGSGLIDSYFQLKEPGESDPRLAGGPIFLNNDDFTMDENFDGVFQKSELRFPQLTIIQDNTFSGYTDAQAIDYSGASAMISKNVVNDPEGRVIPSFIHLNVDCSYLWNVSNGLSYKAYGNQVVGNRIDTGINVLVRADAARGAVPQAGVACRTPGALGQYTVKDNLVARGAELNGQPFTLIQDIGPVDGPNVVAGNCVAGQPADGSAACGGLPSEAPTASGSS
jgi:hypothetical protein